MGFGINIYLISSVSTRVRYEAWTPGINRPVRASARTRHGVWRINDDSSLH